MQWVINLKRIKAKKFEANGNSLCHGCIFFENFHDFDCRTISNISGIQDCRGYIFVLKHKKEKK